METGIFSKKNFFYIYIGRNKSIFRNVNNAKAADGYHFYTLTYDIMRVFMSDKSLLDALAKGDEQAFTVLYEKYWEKLFVVALNRVQSVEIAKELVQDLFADLWKNRFRLAIRKNVSSYLFGALRNIILDHIRKEIVREKYILHISRFYHAQDNATAEQIGLSDLNNALKEAVGQLPPRCRQVYELSRNEHFTNREIADRLDISHKTVENQITKALKILRHHLREYTMLALAIIFLSLS